MARSSFLPLELFLGLQLMTLGKLYTEKEITVMHACGPSKAVLVAAMILAVYRRGGGGQRDAGQPGRLAIRDEVLAGGESQPGIAAAGPGPVQQASDGSAVLFIENVNGKALP